MNSMQEEFIDGFNYMAERVHQNAKDKGWHVYERNDGEMIALMHSELSEALEALRDGDPKSDKIPGFTCVEEELADVVIRVMDYAKLRGLRVAEATLSKHFFNVGREYKHGGKAF